MPWQRPAMLYVWRLHHLLKILFKGQALWIWCWFRVWETQAW